MFSVPDRVIIVDVCCACDVLKGWPNVQLFVY